MGTKYFGLHINKGNKASLDFRNIAARLFLSPKISPDQASRIAGMLSEGSLSVDSFTAKTDIHIKELSEKKAAGEDVSKIMKNKLDAWIDRFKEPTQKDYEYLAQTFGLSKDDIYGVADNDIMGKIKSAKDMAAYVKQFIKGQDKAVDRLSVPFFLHLDSKRKKYTSRIKSPILVVGPTGVGKSETFRKYAEICDCPVIRINTSEITPTGWKGMHISDILALEITEDVSIEDLKYAVIVIHEFDKLTHFDKRVVGSAGSDMDTDMMRDIMRLFETGHSLRLEKKTDLNSLYPEVYNLPVDNLLIVFDGAFNGIERLIKKRLNLGKSIGYSRTKSKYDDINVQSFVTYDDFIKYGFMSELIGRIGDYVVMDPLTPEIMYEIMTTAKENILQAHVDFCAKSNIDLRFEPDALRYIAKKAHESGLGFRNVKTMLSRTMHSLYFDLPQKENAKKKLVINIDEDYVKQHLDNNQLPNAV